MVLVLLVNPVLRATSANAMLRPGELAIITALGLPACGWPGSNFFGTFTGIVAMPSHLLQSEPAWKSREAMSYLPGGSPRIAPGRLSDPEHVLSVLRDGRDEPLAESFLASLDPNGGTRFDGLPSNRTPSGAELRELAYLISGAIETPDFLAGLPESYLTPVRYAILLT